MQFIISSQELMRYMSLNRNDEEIILSILRTYSGIYDMQTAFNLPLIAKKSKHTENQVLAVLHKLKEKDIIDYQSKNNDTSLVFNEIREDERTISRVSKYLENQNQLKKEQLNSVIQYIREEKVCKSKLILDYFGEKTTVDCGICSYCITKKNKKKDNFTLSKEIIALLTFEELNSREIENRLNKNSDAIIFVLRQLLENEEIQIKSNNKYTLKS
jgi:ATP-dependent DNA helicase RecQ